MVALSKAPVSRMATRAPLCANAKRAILAQTAMSSVQSKVRMSAIVTAPASSTPRRRKQNVYVRKGLLEVIAPTNAQVVLMEMCAMAMESAHQIRRLGKRPAHALARSLVPPVSITALGVRNQTVRSRVMDMANAH